MADTISERAKMEREYPELVGIFARRDEERAQKQKELEERLAKEVAPPLDLDSHEWRMCYHWHNSHAECDKVVQQVMKAGFIPQWGLYDSLEWIVRW